MSAKIEEHVYPEGAQYWFHCPGCKCSHAFTVKKDGTGWKFNGDFEKPTFPPSLLCNGHDPSSRCHSFVTDGKIQFLSDCFHTLKSLTVEMQDSE